jgi:hypothetical protein
MLLYIACYMILLLQLWSDNRNRNVLRSTNCPEVGWCHFDHDTNNHVRVCTCADEDGKNTAHPNAKAMQISVCIPTNTCASQRTPTSKYNRVLG